MSKFPANLNPEQLRAFVRSDTFRGIVIGAISVLILVIVFKAGVAVGFHRAAFSYQLDQNYGRTFGRPAAHMLGLTAGAPDPHGGFGKIVSVSASSIVIANGTGPEVQIELAADTMIRDQDKTADVSTLAVGSYVIVFGQPTDKGAVQAKLIRIVPAPMGMTAASSTPRR